MKGSERERKRAKKKKKERRRSRERGEWRQNLARTGLHSLKISWPITHIYTHKPFFLFHTRFTYSLRPAPPTSSTKTNPTSFCDKIRKLQTFRFVGLFRDFINIRLTFQTANCVRSLQLLQSQLHSSNFLIRFEFLQKDYTTYRSPVIKKSLETTKRSNIANVLSFHFS